MTEKGWKRLGILCASALILGGCANDGKKASEGTADSALPAEETEAGGWQEDGSGMESISKEGLDGAEEERGYDQGTEEGAGGSQPNIQGGNDADAAEEESGGDQGTEESVAASLPNIQGGNHVRESAAGTFGDGAAGAEPAEADLAERAREAYRTVLEDVYFDQKFPGGQDFGYQPGANYDVTSNTFAIYDIDADGEEELILCYTTTYTAGMSELIYGFDSAMGTVSEELRAYPLVTYYDNGIIEEGLSHNHGMAPDGDFWPYNVYRYDGEEDRYLRIASVDAWSRAYREEDYDGNPFPEEIDADGDGLVYCITEGEDGEEKRMLDESEYQEWRASWMGEAQQIRLPVKNLTPDNINAEN